MKRSKNQRQKLFIDRAVQGSLLVHLLVHWLLFFVSTIGFLFFVELLTGDLQNTWSSTLRRHGPTLLAFVALAPIFVLDLCKLSNRFAGPIVRLRGGLRSLARGENVPPMHFREHDFWKELADDFNQVAVQVRTSDNQGDTNVPDRSRDTRHESSDEPVGIQS